MADNIAKDMAGKPGPKKKIDKIKRYKDTQGEHVVSPDGSHVKIGGSTFRRTVLPSVAVPKKGDDQSVADLQDIDLKIVGEQASDSD